MRKGEGGGGGVEGGGRGMEGGEREGGGEKEGKRRRGRGRGKEGKRGMERGEEKLLWLLASRIRLVNSIVYMLCSTFPSQSGNETNTELHSHTSQGGVHRTTCATIISCKTMFV